MKYNVFFKNHFLSSVPRFYFFALFALLAYRLIFIYFLPFSGDEAYHWEWSRHLAFSYYDHPPMTAWLIALFSTLLGSSRFTARLTAFLCSTGGLIFIYLLTKQIFGKATSYRSIWLYLAIPVFTAFSIMITTDPPLIFFWSASLFFTYQAIYKKPSYWLIAGLFTGGALLCKFLGIHIISAIFFYIILSPKRKPLLSTPYFYLFFLIVFVTILPILFWNSSHDWATFKFNFSRRHTFAFEWKNVFDYILVQILIVGLFPAFLFIAGSFTSAKKLLSQRDKPFWLLLSFAIPILTFFFLISFTRRVGAHWPICAYLSLIPIAASYLYQKKSRFLYTINIILPIVLAICLTIVLLFPHKISSHLAYKYQKKATTRRLIHFYGWQEAAKKLNELLDEMPKGATILGESYGVASLMAIYSGRKVSSHVLNLYGIHGLNYYYWDSFEKTKGMNSIYVTASKKEKEPSLSTDEQKNLAAAFEKIELLPPLKIYIANKHVRTFLFVKCFNLIGPLTTNKPL